MTQFCQTNVRWFQFKHGVSYVSIIVTITLKCTSLIHMDSRDAM